MERATEWLRVPLPDPEEFIETPVRVRRAFEELGPTFIKVWPDSVHAGGCVSTRLDCRIRKLQTDVLPLPLEYSLQPWLFKLP